MSDAPKATCPSCKSTIRYRKPTDNMARQARLRCDCAVVDVDLVFLTMPAEENAEREKVAKQWGAGVVDSVLAVLRAA